MPKVTRADIDLEHIVAGHTTGGARAGRAKTLFPESWDEKRIGAVISRAYKAGKRVLTQGERVKVKGESDGLVLEIWVNMKTKQIETAYPV